MSRNKRSVPTQPAPSQSSSFLQNIVDMVVSTTSPSKKQKVASATDRATLKSPTTSNTKKSSKEQNPKAQKERQKETNGEKPGEKRVSKCPFLSHAGSIGGNQTKVEKAVLSPTEERKRKSTLAAIKKTQQGIESLSNEVHNVFTKLPRLGNGLHASLHHPAAREWTEPHLHPANLVYPLFVTYKDDDLKVPNFEPNILWGKGKNGKFDSLIKHLKQLEKRRLRCVMLFGVVKEKDPTATSAMTEDTPVIVASKLIRERCPDLMVMCDVCMCEYTDHGHCGWLKKVESEPEEVIDNEKSIHYLAEIALAYAKAGAHWVCPSDMLDGRVGMIRTKLDSHGYNYVGIMAYTSKKASAMYGPFRNCTFSSFQGDRKRYQQPVGSTIHAMQALERDVQEGAAAVLVKPALFYGDIIKEYSQKTNLLVACYVVSGEYVMLADYAERTNDFENILKESHIGLLRAGANIIVTYFTPRLLEMISEGKF